MKLDRALRVAAEHITDADLVIYRSRNGQYMTARQGNPAITDKAWTPLEFMLELGSQDVKKGDRVVVVAPHITFDDYGIGSTAVVRYLHDPLVDGYQGVKVDWEKPYYNTSADGARCGLVWTREVRVIPHG